MTAKVMRAFRSGAVGADHEADRMLISVRSELRIELRIEC